MAQTLTQQFAEQYAKGVVPAMLKTIKAAKRDTRLILAGVLAITYPHQAMFLSTVHGIGVLGWIIPAVVDLAMLRMLGIVQTTGMRTPAKRAALVMTGVLGAISAAVNVAAPAAWAARGIFGALVLVAVGVKFVTALVGPDFAAIEATETAATATVGEAKAGRRCEPGCTCRKHAKARQLTPAQKAAITRQRRKEERELAAMTDGYVPANAPVSPAPLG